MEIKSIGSVIPPIESFKTEEFKIAAKSFAHIESLIPKDKKLLCEQIVHFCTKASDAYSYYNAQYLDDAERIKMAFGQSLLVKTHYGIITDILKKEDVVKYQHAKEVNEKIDKIANWLSDNGWIGLPKPIYPDGSVKIKTACMIMSDMAKIAQKRYDLALIMEANNTKK